MSAEGTSAKGKELPLPELVTSEEGRVSGDFKTVIVGNENGRYIRERQYLKAVSPKAIIWYGCSFKAFEGALESKEAVRQPIVELRQLNVCTGECLERFV